MACPPLRRDSLASPGADREAIVKTQRRPIPIATQIDVYFRDRWLCHLCHRPVILHLALKHAAQAVHRVLPKAPLAYWAGTWSRDGAPLLDELAASIDHVEPLAQGGADDISNYAAVCARCNARKSARRDAEYIEAARPWKVKGKHGEPAHWDGLSSLYVALVKEGGHRLSPTERRWYELLAARLARGSGRAV